MITGFDQNNRMNPFDPREIESIVLSILVIVVGYFCFYFARQEYLEFAPVIDKLKFVGIVGVYFVKFLYAFLLLMFFVIIHVFVVIKLMEILRSLFKF